MSGIGQYSGFTTFLPLLLALSAAMASTQNGLGAFLLADLLPHLSQKVRAF
jgi:hypothetical protein